MFKLLSVTAAAALICGPALAQSAAPPAKWAGWYAGLNVGYGWDSDGSASVWGWNAGNQAALASGLRPTMMKSDRNGVLGGGQVGYNMQRDALVYGLEADFSGLDSYGSATYRNAAPFGTSPAGERSYFQHDLDWLGTVRGRVGWAMGPSLLYATGGYAYGDVRTRAEFDGTTDSAVSYAGDHDRVASGWAAGAGVEYKLGQFYRFSNSSVRVEWLYYDLGHANYTAFPQAAVPGAYAIDAPTAGNIIRVGFNVGF